MRDLNVGERTRVKGQWTYFKECINLSSSLPTVVYECVCVFGYTVSFKFSTVVPQLQGAEWHGRNSESFTITAWFNKFQSINFFFVCLHVLPFSVWLSDDLHVYIYNDLKLQTHWQTRSGCTTSISKREEISFSVYGLSLTAITVMYTLWKMKQSQHSVLMQYTLVIFSKQWIRIMLWILREAKHCCSSIYI